MNERIRELAEQAREYANSKEPYEKIKNKAWIDVYDEKFAELIIRECAAEADKQTIYCRGIPWGRWIKEHFGVKE
jgi:hypothetical protein